MILRGVLISATVASAAGRLAKRCLGDIPAEDIGASFDSANSAPLAAFLTLDLTPRSALTRPPALPHRSPLLSSRTPFFPVPSPHGPSVLSPSYRPFRALKSPPTPCSLLALRAVCPLPACDLPLSLTSFRSPELYRKSSDAALFYKYIACNAFRLAPFFVCGCPSYMKFTDAPFRWQADKPVCRY
jgi:hypothetical protein